MSRSRTEHDSLGPIDVPEEALYGAQTQRAVVNFPLSGLRLPRRMIQALGYLKAAAAQANAALELLDPAMAQAIDSAAQEVAAGQWDAHFPVDIFQTGSGTSSNMNANEVIAHLASQRLEAQVHPNDHVNQGQSSNDVFPSAMHVAAYIEGEEQLLPALTTLRETITARSREFEDLVISGRTHLMDAVPLTLGQALSGWAAQVDHHQGQLTQALETLRPLALGGSAVGTGLNAHPEFASRAIAQLSSLTGQSFIESDNHFAAQSAIDGVVGLSGQLRNYATALMKMANDLRWMNSGPYAGLGEITLPALQPGSSIMPGKVNPVLPEAVTMLCAQVMGNDTTIAIAAQSGQFQLNVMLPVAAYNLLQSLELLANGSRLLATHAMAGFEVNRARIQEPLARNPILATALNPHIGYDAAARIAKEAAASGRTVLAVAKEQTELDEQTLTTLLDPARLTGRD